MLTEHVGSVSVLGRVISREGLIGLNSGPPLPIRFSDFGIFGFRVQLLAVLKTLLQAPLSYTFNH